MAAIFLENLGRKETLGQKKFKKLKFEARNGAQNKLFCGSSDF
jgi:hypothetical protein